mmetsp:Transcript_19343/g.22833  ORF Transcript_19343/g.22833 Transcript_19343/m.22833 type:complete len:146 (-) Transcript_19343:53-490(-)
MEKHGVQQKLKGYLGAATIQADADWWRKVVEYMKTLSPSGVELEIMGLTSFDFSEDMQADQNYYLNKFLESLLLSIRAKGDADFCQALLNCCLKTNYELITQDEQLVDQLKTIQRAGKRNFADFEDLLGHNLCMISHFTGVQIRN